MENSIVSLRKIAGLFLLAACSSATRGNNAQLTGGATAQLAVDQFLKAVNAKDLQAMSTVFGTKNGPARETKPQDRRAEIRERTIVLIAIASLEGVRPPRGIRRNAPAAPHNQEADRRS